MGVVPSLESFFAEDNFALRDLALGNFGAMTSISGLQPLFKYLEVGRKTINMGYYSYYPLVLLIVILAGLPLLAYLFPEKKKKLLRKWKQRKA